MSLFSKFKQQFVEFFDKDKKTIDENLQKRLEIIHQFDSELKSYIKNVDNFCISAIQMIDAHNHFGEIIKLIYQDSAFKIYIFQVGSILGDSEQLKGKIQILISNIKKMCELTFKSIAEMKSYEEPRENARVFYDHYRAKMQKLEKSHGASSDKKKQEKYQRNLQKFNEAKKKFEDENKKLENGIEQAQIKVEVVMNQLVIRFTKEIEAQFFIQINEQFQQLQDIEEKMREVVTQAAQGQFGSVGQGVDLDVNF